MNNEVCVVCDCTEVEIREELVESQGVLKFEYLSMYYHCTGCGFDYVGRKFSNHNFKNRNSALLEYLKIDSNRLQILQDMFKPEEKPCPLCSNEKGNKANLVKRLCTTTKNHYNQVVIECGNSKACGFQFVHPHTSRATIYQSKHARLFEKCKRCESENVLMYDEFDGDHVGFNCMDCGYRGYRKGKNEH